MEQLFTKCLLRDKQDAVCSFDNRKPFKVEKQGHLEEIFFFRKTALAAV